MKKRRVTARARKAWAANAAKARAAKATKPVEPKPRNRLSIRVGSRHMSVQEARELWRDLKVIFGR